LCDYGLRLDLEQPAGVDERVNHDGGVHRPDLTKRLAVSPPEVLEVGLRRQIDPRANHVGERTTSVGHGLRDDLDAALRLAVGVRRRVASVGHDRSAACDEHAVADADRPRVAKQSLVRRAG
jgi:hypothetical protein